MKTKSVETSVSERERFAIVKRTIRAFILMKGETFLVDFDAKGSLTSFGRMKRVKMETMDLTTEDIVTHRQTFETQKRENEETFEEVEDFTKDLQVKLV